MWIRAFSKFVKVEATTDHILNDSTVVIDAQNFFYKQCQSSGLQFIFGCESDKYAEYLRKYLSMFKKANVKCYFIFKGGHADMAKRLGKNLTVDYMDIGRTFVVGNHYDDIVLPIFMKTVYKQVLDEMQFDYVISEFEAKRECIALAQKLQCPILSHDIEFCFSGLLYIPYLTLKFDEETSTIECKRFILEDFLKKFSLTEEKLAIFVVLTDQNIFPVEEFMAFLEYNGFLLGHYKRNKAILQWLSGTNDRQTALDTIFRLSNYGSQQKDIFFEKEAKVKAFIRRQETPGLPSEYFESDNTLQVTDNDPKWFEKGVALKHIALQCVNIYRNAVVCSSWAIQYKEADDAMVLSMEIVRYIFDLMTNFKDKELNFVSDGNLIPAPAISIQKPNNYEAIDSVFENGWNRVKPLKLFEHFLVSTLQINLESLDNLPEDVKLLMISLIYFSRKKAVDVTNEVYSVLLSYIALAILSNELVINSNVPDMSAKPVLDSCVDKESILDSDKVTAAAILKGYFGKVSQLEAKKIFDAQMLHPLVEFQHCLDNMNYLNSLCGCPYNSTIYSKTFNGTFVYKILYEINKNHDKMGLNFIQNTLNPAATVLAFMNGLIDKFDEVRF